MTAEGTCKAEERNQSFLNLLISVPPPSRHKQIRVGPLCPTFPSESPPLRYPTQLRRVKRELARDITSS